MDLVKGVLRFDPPMNGETNMQVDNDLLQSLTPESPITLRLYRWSQPTLSLGHFQQEKDILSNWPISQSDRVRRRTGGGAILHDQEWTYSLAIPNSSRFGFKNLGLKGHCEVIYRAVHNSVAEGLRSLGWEASLSEECTCSLNADNGGEEAFLCFLRRSPVDVIVGTDKILGSAQRRANTGLLQHGSFILRRSELAPELSGILDLPRNLHPEDVLQTVEIFQAADTELQQMAEKLDNLVDIQAGVWLAKQIMSGIETIFRCEWKLG